MKVPITVVDYEAGNLRSVVKALENVGAEPLVTQEPSQVRQATALLLPGVGAGDTAMDSLRQRCLVDAIREFVASSRPFLGVCLGLQLLMESTEEGEAPCLGVLAGRVKRLPSDVKVPHMGWNQVHFRLTHPVWRDIPQESHFYFVHSYYAQPKDNSVVAATTEYGVTFCSAVARDNLVATQFHPEKSGPLGLRIYENFLRFCREC